jgi:hypothetical protein
MNLLDETWANRKSSPDTSENFQLKIKEIIKKKAKTPTSNRVQTTKHTITLINNPQRGNSQFKILNNINNENRNEALMKNDQNSGGEYYNYSQTINSAFKNNLDKKEEEDSNLADDISHTTEKINKLHVNCVKTNDLRERDSKYLNIEQNANNNNLINFSGHNFNNFNNFAQFNNNLNSSTINEYTECNEEFNYSDNFGNRDLSKKTLNPKFMERNNTLTRLSTNESNDSFESAKNNKFGNNLNFDEKFSYSTPVINRNFPHTPMIQYPQGKKINFNNYNNYNFNYSNTTPAGFYNSSANGGSCNYNNGINMNMNMFSSNNNENNINSNILQHQNQQQNPKINLQNLPENAFSYNTENNMNLNNNFNPKYNSDKKKIKKSREEVDQTLFIINTQNIIEGKDKRTTVMIRHIPNKYSTQSLLEEINFHFKGKYDFFYLPMDFEVIFNF